MATNETALTVIRRHQEPSVAPPVDVRAIASDLGIRVYLDRGLGTDISGKIERSRKTGGSSGFAIRVNARHPHEWQRFTIAHELAHYVLHRDMIGEGGDIVDDAMYRSSLNDSYEVQANRFAAEILMPKRLLTREVALGRHSVDVLASRFDVSKQSMEIRLSSLDLRQTAFEWNE